MATQTTSSTKLSLQTRPSTVVLAQQDKASELAMKLAQAEQALADWRDANNGVCPTCLRDGFDPVAHKHHKDTHEDTRVVVPEHT
jgi:hypothetical protein